MRLANITHVECATKIAVGRGGTLVVVYLAGEAADADAPGSPRGIQPSDEDPYDGILGYWQRLNNNDRAFIATVAPCDGPHTSLDDEAATTPRRGAHSFDDWLHGKLKDIYLTTIASGVTNLGHIRARMADKRGAWAVGGTPQQRLATTSIATKLNLGAVAQDASKPDMLHS